MKQLDLFEPSFKPRMLRSSMGTEQPATKVAPASTECPIEPPMEFWVNNTGDTPAFLLEGGTIDVLFNNGDIVREVTLANPRGVGDTDYMANDWGVMPHVNSGIRAWRKSNGRQSDVKHVKSDSDIEVSCRAEYTLKIKGHVITLTSDEYLDLMKKMEDV